RMRRPSATSTVLGLLCVMYLITYMDRVNIATAGPAIQKDLGLSTIQLGHILSAFGYPYFLFQVFGGWIGDRAGARRTLFLCGLIWASATILTGLVATATTLFLVRVLLGVGEGATFPVATRAMQNWTPGGNRGFAQGITHAFARFGNAATPPLVAWLIGIVTWRGSFVAVGVTSLVWVAAWIWYFRDDPAKHPDISREELARLPPSAAQGPQGRVEGPRVRWGPLVTRMLPVTVVYFCYGWTLWLYLNWLPSFFTHEYALDISKSALFSSAVFFAGVAGDLLGGAFSDTILKRTGSVRTARLSVIIFGFVCSGLCLLPMFATRDLTVIVLSLAAGFFFAELVIGPIWAIPMDIAPQFAGTASGIMNSGSALAAILSPLAFAYVAEITGDWHLPFAGSLGLLLLGAVLALTLHPERALAREI
ncbi:MAG TPA: MFS transporter, partial [Vicinamibacterales bacterium]|nr:MFS transporter [Vicinamibacterales bacterium]